MLEYRRRLPHLQPDGVHLFLTWRLWGSLPAKPEILRHYTPGQTFVAQDRALDRATGPRWLGDTRIARMVADTIRRGETLREMYDLRAWVIMPNHIHLLILPRTAVPSLTRWVKGSAARRANALLGRTGEPFWQDESYDRWMRNVIELEKTVRYIERNPVSAGLTASVEDWPWSSAGQAEAPAPPDSPNLMH
jgi:REP element-mobilizing transposase RayT